MQDALSVLDKRLDEQTAAALDQIVPPGSAVADFHNTSGWMKMRVTSIAPLPSLDEMYPPG